MARTRRLPPEAKGWDLDVQHLAQDLLAVGELWAENRRAYERLNARRKELFLALDGKLTRQQMADLFGCEKGAVDRTFSKLRANA